MVFPRPSLTLSAQMRHLRLAGVQLLAALRRSEAVVHRRFAGRILAALQVTDPEPKLNPGSSRRLKSTLPKPTRSPENPPYSQYDDFPACPQLLWIGQRAPRATSL